MALVYAGYASLVSSIIFKWVQDPETEKSESSLSRILSCLPCGLCGALTQPLSTKTSELLASVLYVCALAVHLPGAVLLLKSVSSGTLREHSLLSLCLRTPLLPLAQSTTGRLPGGTGNDRHMHPEPRNRDVSTPLSLVLLVSVFLTSLSVFL